MNKPTTIERKLSQLRSQLTRWILIDGLGRWLWIALAVLVADMLLDRVFKMDQAQRTVMLVLMLLAIGALFVWRVLKPLTRRATDEALLYEVEEKHPELKEAVLASYELSHEPGLATSGASPELVERTIQQGIERADAIDFSDALNRGMRTKNWSVFGVGALVAGVLAIGIVQTDFLSTWFNRNILLLNDQWPQGTYLEIAGVKDGKITVSRGSDYRQLVTVADKSTVTDVSVSLEVDNPAGRSILPMKPTGKMEGREHLFTFHNVSSKFRFRAVGGDEITQWVEVELVEPPGIVNLNLQPMLPDYTGQEAESLVGSGPHSVLKGSQLSVSIKTNKPLNQASLMLGEDLIEMQRQGSDQEYAVTLPVNSEAGGLRGGEYQFALIDSQGISSNRKSKFKITIKEDKPPQVRASLLGISGLVVPRAMLPTAYQAADEYGLTELAFDCNWIAGDEDASKQQSENVIIASLGQDGVLATPTARVDSDAVLQLETLKLQPGTSLRISIRASDNFPNPANTGRSQEFLLRVVSEPELRADLLRREVEQREAFDQAYQRQMALATELQAIGLRQKPNDITDEAYRAQRESDLIGTVREQKGIGTAIARVADRFEDFLVEVKNNRLDEAENQIAPEQRIETRFDQKIIQPIRRLDEQLIALASRQLDNCRISAGDAEQLTQALAVADGLHQEILIEMKKILDAMNDSENFQSIINDILEIKRETEAMKKKVGEQQDAGPDIFDDKDIFDQ